MQKKGLVAKKKVRPAITLSVWLLARDMQKVADPWRRQK